MSKPIGLTWDFRVTHPSRVEDKIWDAVEEAICTPGYTVKQFIREAAAAWDYHLEDSRKSAAKEFEKAEKP